MYHGQASAVVVCSPGVAASEHTGGRGRVGSGGARTMPSAADSASSRYSLEAGSMSLRGSRSFVRPPASRTTSALVPTLGRLLANTCSLPPTPPCTQRTFLVSAGRQAIGYLKSTWGMARGRGQLGVASRLQPLIVSPIAAREPPRVGISRTIAEQGVSKTPVELATGSVFAECSHSHGFQTV